MGKRYFLSLFFPTTVLELLSPLLIDMILLFSPFKGRFFILFPLFSQNKFPPGPLTSGFIGGKTFSLFNRHWQLNSLLPGRISEECVPQAKSHFSRGNVAEEPGQERSGRAGAERSKQLLKSRYHAAKPRCYRPGFAAFMCG